MTRTIDKAFPGNDLIFPLIRTWTVGANSSDSDTFVCFRALLFTAPRDSLTVARAPRSGFTRPLFFQGSRDQMEDARWQFCSNGLYLSRSASSAVMAQCSDERPEARRRLRSPCPYGSVEFKGTFRGMRLSGGISLSGCLLERMFIFVPGTRQTHLSKVLARLSALCKAVSRDSV